MDGIGRVITSSAVCPPDRPARRTPRLQRDTQGRTGQLTGRTVRIGTPSTSAVATPVPPLADCTSTCSPTGVRIYSYADADRCDPAETSSGAVYVGLGVPAFEVAVQGPREFWHLMVWASCGRVVLFGQGVEVG